MKSLFTLLMITTFVLLAKECQAVKINKISVPPFFDLHNDENKDQPLILECDYEIDEDEKGLVLKWLHNSSSIYQWIPDNKRLPTPLKAFKHRIDLEYNNELPIPQRYSTLVIKNPTIADSGNYSCDVQTYKSADKKTAQMMIVYVDEAIDLSYSIDQLEEQVSFECVINQIYPLPDVTLLIGDEVRNFTWNHNDFHVSTYNGFHNVSVNAQISKENIEDDAEVACIVKIPDINYEKRTVINYDDPNKSAKSVTNNTIIGEYRQDIDENNGISIRGNILLSLIMCAILSAAF